MTADLIAFLNARLDEDEATAKDAPWELDEGTWPFWIDTDNEHDLDRAEQYRDQFRPSRMLRDVETKRRIIDETFGSPDHEEMWEFHTQLLALPYAGHEDYREEWKP